MRILLPLLATIQVLKCLLWKSMGQIVQLAISHMTGGDAIHVTGAIQQLAMPTVHAVGSKTGKSMGQRYPELVDQSDLGGSF